jgi:hypothetical protein
MVSGVVRWCAISLWMAVWTAACGVAPVRWNGSAEPPPQWTYVGAHGRPLAYRGGVCAVSTPHQHKYPPVPRAAFQETAGGYYDTRPVVPFLGRHPHHGRTCHLEGWHLHHEVPDAELVFDDQAGAWRQVEGA